MRPRLARAVAALLAWIALTGAAARGDGFAFAVIGDAPYTDAEREALVAHLATLDAEPLSFVVHVGDFKNGYSACTDALYQDRLRLFESSRHPLVYLPGDNDWTDCHRVGGGDPEERLARLRMLFFPSGRALGRSPLTIERQPAGADGCCPENVRWWQDDVMMLGLHVVGSDNHHGPGAQPTAEFRARLAATLGWLHTSFAQASARGARAVVVFFHANVRLERRQGHGRGFDAFVDALVEAIGSVDRPVLVVHGDTHQFRIDRPARLALANPGKTVMRLESYGSPRVGWVGVRVNPANHEPFSFFGGR